VTGGYKTTRLRLYPKPGKLADKGEIYDDLDLPHPGPRRLPYVLINMVSSVDGRSSANGKASGIGGQADRGAMRALRSCVDAVMVGAGTLRAEKLNLGLDDTEVGQPLAVVVGGAAGGLPVLEHLVRPVGQDVILALPHKPVAEKHTTNDEAGEGVKTLRCSGLQPDRVDIRRLLQMLKADHAVDRLLVEGGPGLNRSLIDAGLVDEIFLTVAPKLLLGPEATIVSGALGNGGRVSRQNLTLLSVHSADDELFLRYRFGDPR
jgi:2,5-diamino-6-(ribosylamino)-4(3H)-pyrimidinone 5'-phosphate reductase